MLIHGRVQGVGFRWFTLETAESLGLTGWVKNRMDGTVEAEAQGTETALEEFIERLKTGNPAAKVASIEAKPAPVVGEKTFRII